MAIMFQTDRLTPAGIHRRTGAERVSPPPTAARRAQVKHCMVTSGLNGGRLAKWELTQEASHCSNIFGRKIFSSQYPVLVCQPHLNPHLVAGLITFHLQATKVALTIQHFCKPIRMNYAGTGGASYAKIKPCLDNSII